MTSSLRKDIAPGVDASLEPGDILAAAAVEYVCDELGGFLFCADDAHGLAFRNLGGALYRFIDEVEVGDVEHRKVVRPLNCEAFEVQFVPDI